MIEQIVETFRAKLANRRVDVNIPAGRSVKIHPNDDAEPAVKTEGGIGLAFYIEYRAADGELSKRRISCKRFEPATNTVLAYCYERRAARRFRVDRILLIVVPETGEVLDREGWLDQLGGEGLHRRDERLTRLLTVLVFLMRCDRHEHPAEAEVIERAVTSFALRFDGDDAMIEGGVALAKQLAPDADDVAMAIRWIDKREERGRLARLVLPFIDQVIVADGAIASEEAYFGGLLKDAFRGMSA